MSGSRANVRLGWWAEKVVLQERNALAHLRGWGLAVPLAPAFPADILDLTPTGPVFIEVKATRQARFPALSGPELAFADECRTMGAKMVVAVVRPEGKGVPPARYSLSYSPVPRVGPRTGRRGGRKPPARLHAAVPFPPAEPTIGLGREPETARRMMGSVTYTTVGATPSGPSPAAPRGGDEDPQGHDPQQAEAPESEHYGGMVTPGDRECVG